MPRSGRPSDITDEAKAWVVSIACESPTKFGLASETWTYCVLSKYFKESCISVGNASLINTVKSFLNNVLSKSNINPHKISYYYERKDSESDIKMASVLHANKEVALINDNNLCANKHTTVSYDEKPGIQASKNIAPQLQPVPNKHNCLSLSVKHESYK